MVDTDNSHALASLGYCRDGAIIRFNGFFVDVPSDDAGGESGPPADLQYLGETANVTLELTKFDATVASTIVPRVWGGTAGQPAAPTGNSNTLMFQGSLSYRLVLVTGAAPYNFPRVVFREPHEINRGAKYSTWRLEATAYRNGSGILWNNNTS
jgi:hypothetical protein